VSFAQIVIRATHLLFAVMALGLIFLGAWGSIPGGRSRAATPLGPKQRVMVTIFGLFLLAAVWHNASGWLPLGG